MCKKQQQQLTWSLINCFCRQSSTKFRWRRELWWSREFRWRCKLWRRCNHWRSWRRWFDWRMSIARVRRRIGSRTRTRRMFARNINSILKERKNRLKNRCLQNKSRNQRIHMKQKNPQNQTTRTNNISQKRICKNKPLKIELKITVP